MSGLFDQITNYSPPLLTAGQVNYKGTWDASANSPALTSPPAATSKGDYYVVSAAGTQFGITFAVGDWIISNGTVWEKVDLTDAVSSVFGRTGAVVGASTDYSAVGLTNTAIGASSPSTGAFTTVTASSTIAATGAVTGSNLSGTNTGDQTITLTGGVTGSGTGSFAATVVTNANLTGAVTSVGNATSLGSFSSANLSAALTDETGSGAAVFATSPTLVTPILGTPASGNLANCTFPTLNQNTTGSAATLTTARAIYGNSFDGSAALTQAITGTYGGTGVNNGANTITIAGNVTHAGAFTQSFTATANTSLTLPTTGTLATLAGSEALSNKTITASAFSGTTGTFSGQISHTSANPTASALLLTASTGTNAVGQRFNNTGGNFYIGRDNSTSSAVTGSGNPYDGYIWQESNYPVCIGVNNALVGRFTSTGLAVTGTLSASGTFTAIGFGVNATPTGLGTNVTYARWLNTSGDFYIGCEGSTAGGFFTGSSAYASVFYSSNPIQAIISGVKRAEVSSTGLAVTGNIAFNNDQTERFIKGSANGGAIRLRSNSAAATDRGTQIGYTDNSGVWQAAYLSVVDGGNVGIGATSPASILHLKKDAAGNGVSTTFEISTGTKTNWRIGCQNNVDNGFEITPSTAAGGLTFSTPVASFTSTGLAVTGALSLTGAITISGSPSGQGAGVRYISGAATSMDLYSNAATGGVHYWAIGESIKATLTGTGLGIGTTSPQQQLTVSGAGTNDGGLYFNTTMQNATTAATSAPKTGICFQAFYSGTTSLANFAGISGGKENTTDGNASGVLIFSTATSGSSPAERARIDSSGNLLVGCTSVPSGSVAGSGFENTGASGQLKLKLSSSTTTTIGLVEFLNPNGSVGYISTSGSATAYNTSSDYRLKDNQQPLTGSGAFIDALQPKTWEWKADGSKGVGFIAHEVQAVSPGSVVGEKDAVDEDGKPIYQAMQASSSEVIANLVAELQSVRQRLAALESN